jgi:hypothetical protein
MITYRGKSIWKKEPCNNVIDRRQTLNTFQSHTIIVVLICDRQCAEKVKSHAQEKCSKETHCVIDCLLVAMNQNSTHRGLSLPIRDVNCCPSFRGIPIHINPDSTQPSDCSDRMTPNHTEEQRPSVLEDAIRVESRALRNWNQSNADDFIKRLSGASLQNSRLKSIRSTQSPEIMRLTFRSAKNRNRFALWREHTQCSGVPQ